MAGIADFFQGALNQYNQQQQQKRQFEEMIKKYVVQQQIKNQIAQQDPLSQLLKQGQAADAQMKIFQAGGPRPSLYGQQGPQPNIQMQGGQMPMDRMPQQMPQQGNVPMQGPQMGGVEYPTQQPFIQVQKGTDIFGRSMGTEAKPNPAYVNPLEARKFKIQQEGRKRIQQQQIKNVLNSARDTLSTIKEIEKGKSYFGALGGLPSIPGTQRVAWEANIRKLLADKVLKVMSDLKAASKTGSTGFGQLSEKELQLLQDAATALKRTMKPEEAMKYLKQMKQPMLKILEEKESSINEGSGQGFSYLWE